MTDWVPAGGVGNVGGSRLTLERFLIVTSNLMRTFLATNWPTVEREKLAVVAEISLAPSSARDSPSLALAAERSTTVTVPAAASTRIAMARAARPALGGGG